jgi:hypothetical protein
MSCPDGEIFDPLAGNDTVSGGGGGDTARNVRLSSTNSGHGEWVRCRRNSSDLEWLVLPPMVLGQCAVIEATEILDRMSPSAGGGQ